MKKFLFFVFVFCYSTLFSGGLSTTCGMMMLGNLKIGQEYSLRQLLGYNFNVHYRGKYPVDIKIETMAPSTTTPDGFEPIPDINWIRVQKEFFSLDPGERGETDIIIKIPNDESLLGRKFRAIITPQTSPPKGGNLGGVVFSLGISCNLFLSIAPKPPTEEEIREQRKRFLSNEVNFSISPERIFLYDIEPEKVYDLSKEFGEIIKVINATRKKVNVKLEVISAQQVGIFSPEGFEEVKNLSAIKLSPKKFTLPEDSIKSVKITLSTKKWQENKKEILEESNTTSSESKKKYFMVVKVNLQNEFVDINNYVKFYIIMK